MSGKQGNGSTFLSVYRKNGDRWQLTRDANLLAGN
jgi:hypothetical protein